MTIEHSALPDAQLHEPKGVATASAGMVYVADGAGSGVWTDHDAIAKYGEMYITTGAGTVALAAASAYVKLDPTTHWSNGVAQGITLDGANAQITIPDTGAYNISFWISFTTAALAAGTQYFFKYAVNGTPGSRIISTSKETAGADNLDTAASGIASLTAGDILSIWVGGDGTSSSTSITVKEAGLTLHKI